MPSGAESSRAEPGGGRADTVLWLPASRARLSVMTSPGRVAGRCRPPRALVRWCNRPARMATEGSDIVTLGLLLCGPEVGNGLVFAVGVAGLANSDDLAVDDHLIDQSW